MKQQESGDFAPSGALAASGDVGWRVALTAMVAGSVGLIWMHWDTAVSMYDLWSEIHTYNHAFLVLPVCVYLAWERRHVIRELPLRFSLFGTLLVFGFGALWLVANAVDVMVGRHIALVGMIEGLILATLGWRVCRALLFPLLYAWLVVPVDFGLLPGLQKMATIASAWGIGTLGIPIFVEDVFIEIPTGRYWVAPGCAGLNFLLSGFALALLYGEQMYDGWRKRVGCVAVMILVAIVANWIRIFGLIVAGHYFDAVYDINDHYTEGWLFFAFVVFVMMWIGLRYRDPIRSKKPEGEAHGDMPGPRAASGAIALYLCVAVVTAAGGAFYPAYAAYRQSDLPPPLRAHIAFPSNIGGWQSTPNASDWRVSFNGADVQATRQYVRGDAVLDFYVAYYERQGNGREVVAYLNRVYDDEIWQERRTASAPVNIAGMPTDAAVTHLRSNVRRRVVWHAYWVDGRFTRNPIVAKLLQAKADLLFGDRRAGFIAVSSEQIEDASALETFLLALPPIPALVAPGAAGG